MYADDVTFTVSVAEKMPPPELDNARCNVAGYVMDEVSVASRRSRSTKTLAATNTKKSRGSSKTTSAKPTPPAAAVVAPTNSHKGSNSKNNNNNTNNHVGQGMYFVKQQGKIRYESKYADLSFLSALLVARFDKTRCRQEFIPISTDLNEDRVWCPDTCMYSYMVFWLRFTALHQPITTRSVG